MIHCRGGLTSSETSQHEAGGSRHVAFRREGKGRPMDVPDPRCPTDPLGRHCSTSPAVPPLELLPSATTPYGKQGSGAETSDCLPSVPRVPPGTPMAGQCNHKSFPTGYEPKVLTRSTGDEHHVLTSSTRLRGVGRGCDPRLDLTVIGSTLDLPIPPLATCSSQSSSRPCVVDMAGHTGVSVPLRPSQANIDSDPATPHVAHSPGVTSSRPLVGYDSGTAGVSATPRPCVVETCSDTAMPSEDLQSVIHSPRRFVEDFLPLPPSSDPSFRLSCQWNSQGLARAPQPVQQQARGAASFEPFLGQGDHGSGTDQALKSIPSEDSSSSSSSPPHGWSTAGEQYGGTHVPCVAGGRALCAPSGPQSFYDSADLAEVVVQRITGLLDTPFPSGCIEDVSFLTSLTSHGCDADRVQHSGSHVPSMAGGSAPCAPLVTQSPCDRVGPQETGVRRTQGLFDTLYPSGTPGLSPSAGGVHEQDALHQREHGLTETSPSGIDGASVLYQAPVADGAQQRREDASFSPDASSPSGIPRARDVLEDLPRSSRQPVLTGSLQDGARTPPVAPRTPVEYQIFSPGSSSSGSALSESQASRWGPVGPPAGPPSPSYFDDVPTSSGIFPLLMELESWSDQAKASLRGVDTCIQRIYDLAMSQGGMFATIRPHTPTEASVHTSSVSTASVARRPSSRSSLSEAISAFPLPDARPASDTSGESRIHDLLRTALAVSSLPVGGDPLVTQGAVRSRPTALPVSPSPPPSFPSASARSGTELSFLDVPDSSPVQPSPFSGLAVPSFLGTPFSSGAAHGMDQVGLGTPSQIFLPSPSGVSDFQTPCGHEPLSPPQGGLSIDLPFVDLPVLVGPVPPYDPGQGEVSDDQSLPSTDSSLGFPPPQDVFIGKARYARNRRKVQPDPAQINKLIAEWSSRDWLKASKWVEDKPVLLDTGASHVVLPMYMLYEVPASERKGAAIITLHQATSSEEAVMLNSEIYAKGVEQAICPAGRMLRQLGLNLGWVKGECSITYQSGEIERVLFPVRVTSDLPYLTWEQFEILRDASQHPPSEDEELFAYWSGILQNHGFDAHMAPCRVSSIPLIPNDPERLDWLCGAFQSVEGCQWGKDCPYIHSNLTGHDDAPLCKGYMSKRGCPAGWRCHLRHPEIPGRCLGCGSPQHGAEQCPVLAVSRRRLGVSPPKPGSSRARVALCKPGVGTLASFSPEDCEYLCPYFQSPEGCDWGEGCPYIHSNRTGHDDAPLCKKYMSGSGCSKGSQCLLRHPEVRGKCLECGSSRHDHSRCPVRVARIRERKRNAITGKPGALRAQRSYQ